MNEIKTIRDLLEGMPSVWLELFEQHCNTETPANALTWDLDCVCGEEVVRIARLAIYVASCWRDHGDDVHRVAARQAMTVCYG